ILMQIYLKALAIALCFAGLVGQSTLAASPTDNEIVKKLSSQIAGLQKELNLLKKEIKENRGTIADQYVTSSKTNNEASNKLSTRSFKRIYASEANPISQTKPHIASEQTQQTK